MGELALMPQATREGGPGPAGSSLPSFCWEFMDANGVRIFALPPVPEPGLGIRHIRIVDIIRHEDVWLKRGQAQITGGVADTNRLCAANRLANQELGPMTNWSHLWGREAGKTALVVAAGPSLTESLPELALLSKEEDTFTLGLNRSIRAIDLDYFVTLDRGGQPDWITRDPGDCHLIASVTAVPTVARDFRRRFWGDSFLGGSDEGFAPLRTGLPITLPTAMHAAYKLGARNIRLYGADFALAGQKVTIEGQEAYMLEKYYFDTPPHAGLALRVGIDPEHSPIQGIHDRLCFVNYELWAHCQYTRAMCMMLEGAGVEVRNCSKAGILDWRVDE